MAFLHNSPLERLTQREDAGSMPPLVLLSTVCAELHIMVLLGLLQGWDDSVPFVQ